MAVTVREFGPDDWKLFRDIRLRALADAPYAFGSTFDEERAQPELWWRERLARGPDVAGFSALETERWIGIARVFVGREEEPSVANLVSMWVDPAFRGRGVGRALVERVFEWAREHGATRVDLWVTETNEPAIRLYESCGFVRGEGRQPLPSDPSLGEVAMHRPLA